MLTAFYLFLTAGIPITVHYCHGSLEEIKLLAKTVSCCDEVPNSTNNCCDDEINTDCCSNEIFQFQLDIDEEIVSHDLSYQMFYTNIENNQVDNSVIVFVVEDGMFQFCDLPPPKKQPIWLMNCNFSLYG